MKKDSLYSNAVNFSLHPNYKRKYLCSFPSSPQFAPGGWWFYSSPYNDATLPTTTTTTAFQFRTVSNSFILEIPSHGDILWIQFPGEFWPRFHLQGNLAPCHTKLMPIAALESKCRFSLYCI